MRTIKSLNIDLENGCVLIRGDADDEGAATYDIGTPAAFAAISAAWLRSGWDAKYVYSFTWLGRPIIQLPEDMLRIQEVIYHVQPDVIIETGIAHGGGLVFYASLCKLLSKGRVIGVDIEIRPPNRCAIESHPLNPWITLIEGSSTETAIVARVRAQIAPNETVMVMLDSCHTKDHVLAELRAYAPLVTPSSYIVAMDGIMQELAGAPRTQPDWAWNNPQSAVFEFLQDNSEFALEDPPFLFNEGNIARRVTYWPRGFLKRISPA